MKVLLTGANGFLGKEISRYFKMSLDLLSLSRTPSTVKNGDVILCDLSKGAPNFSNEFFDLIIHVAGLAHFIPKTKEEQNAFYVDNMAITANLLQGLDKIPRKPHYFVFISSVAVYGLESGWNVTENTPLKAEDPYGKSKIDSEKMILEWCERNETVCTILRLPLIVGQNPPGNLGAMVRSIKNQRFPLIAGGVARRSMVLVYDVPKFIEALFQKGGIYHLTDGHSPSFAELVAAMNGNKKVMHIPLWVAKLLAGFGDFVELLFGIELPFNSRRLEKMTSTLTFSSKKVQTVTNLQPASVLSYYLNQNSL